MNDIDTGGSQCAEVTWEVDGIDYRLLTLSEVAGDTRSIIADIRERLCCGELEAEQVLRIIVEDGEFIASVREDIDGLPTFEG